MADEITESEAERAISIGLPIVRELDAMLERLAALRPAAKKLPTSSPVIADSGDKSSHAIGKIGEADVFAAVRSVWPAAENVASKPHSGDIMMRSSDGRVIIEVKNYKTRVPQPQVNKFHNDIKMTGAAGGIFISMASPITGIPVTPLCIQYEHFGKFVPIFYLTQPALHEISAACTMISQLLGAIGYANALVGAREELYSVVADVANTADALSVARVKFGGVIGDVTTQLSDVACDLRTVENSLREYSDIAIKALTVEIADVDDGAQIYADAKYTGYPADLQGAVRAVITKVNAGTPSGKGGWTMRGKRYVHVFTGVGVSLLIRSANVTLSRRSIPTTKIVELLDKHSVIIKGDAVTIDINQDTCGTICTIL